MRAEEMGSLELLASASGQWKEVEPAGDDFSQRFIGRMRGNGDFHRWLPGTKRRRNYVEA
jgi:hypothetical protein